MRIVIADDAVLLRAGLERLLTEAGHEVVATVGDGTALLSAVTTHQPDLAVIDVRMPPTFTDEGVRAARSEEHTSELQSRGHLVCRLLLEKKIITIIDNIECETQAEGK